MGNVLYLVEDEAEVAELLKGVLDHNGYDTRIFSNAEDALQGLKTAPPDWVITDLSLPGMNGYDLLAQILAVYPACRCLILSGQLDAELPPDLVRFGLTEKNFMSKPLKSLGDLFNRLKEL